jgi:hypothetical protein
VEALKVLDITHPGTVSSPVFTEVFCEVVALWSGGLDLLLLASFVLCRISGIPASGRVVAAAGKSLQGYPEIHRSASRPTHKLELVSVCAADRGWLIHLGAAAQVLGADCVTNVVVGVTVLGFVEICVRCCGRRPE